MALGRYETLSGYPSENDDSAALKGCLSCEYIMFVVDMICCCLILLGLLVLLVLACTVGVPYFPIISALSAQQLSTCALSAVSSVATGALGLALSCFFKPKIEHQNQAADQAFTSCCFA